MGNLCLSVRPSARPFYVSSSKCLGESGCTMAVTLKKSEKCYSFRSRCTQAECLNAFSAVLKSSYYIYKSIIDSVNQHYRYYTEYITFFLIS